MLTLSGRFRIGIDVGHISNTIVHKVLGTDPGYLNSELPQYETRLILKAILSVLFFFLHPQISDIKILVFRPNMVRSLQTIHQRKAYLFSFQIMYKSQCQKIDTFDWVCCPGSHLTLLLVALYFKVS